MEGLQAWFAPLLWILATISAIIAFIKLCRPIWVILKTPEQLNQTLVNLDLKISEHFSEIDARLDQFSQDLQQLKEFDNLSDEVQLNLLRDRLSQGYDYYSERGYIGDQAYRSLCDVHAIYEKCGGNSYATAIMNQLHELYKRSQDNQKNNSLKGE